MSIPSNIHGDLPPPPLNPSVAGSGNVVLFTPYERKGVILMAVAGVFSCSLVSTLLVYIISSAFSLWLYGTRDMPTPFIRKQIAVFVICLISSDLIQSISGIVQVKWAANSKIYEGRACTLQAATLVMGDLGSTVWSCVIAAHTFSGLALGKQWSRITVWAIVILGWSAALTLTIIGPTALTNPHKGPFYGIAGEWCFITSEYPIHRLVIHYVPLFIAAVVIFVLYGLLFLVIRGNISFTSHRFGPSGIRLDDVLMRERINIAKRMLWYPAAYLTCIFPIAIIRLVGLERETIPQGVWFFAMFFLFSLGAVDSVIYTTTRNMIKFTSLRRHKQTGTTNSDLSATRVDHTPMTSPWKPNFGDIPKSHEGCSFQDPRKLALHNIPELSHPCNHKEEYQCYPWDEEEVVPHKADRPHDREASPGVAAITVTLERIEQVR